MRLIHAPVRTDAAGRASRWLDLSADPLLSTIAASAPRQWNFQFWYRDNGGSNLTDAVAVDFLD